MPEQPAPHDPAEKPIRPRDAHDTIAPGHGWDGPTYYGRSQLKPAPFDNWVVGSYIFLAGVSGASALLAALVDRARGPGADATVRRGRYLSLLAPTIGSALLVYDLHTPKRFYNMLRIAKPTSPMSIGTWILMAFSTFSGISAVAQFVTDRVRRLAWLRRVARFSQVPAAVAGAGMSTYTASLLTATSTPLWAAAPEALAVRFGASSVAAGAAALSLGERSHHRRGKLDGIVMAALAVEAVATTVAQETYKRKGVDAALEGGWGVVERQGATGLGVMLPLGLHALTFARAGLRKPDRRAGEFSNLASLAVLAGSLLLRVSVMAEGDASASRPEVSLRFAQPRNLPENFHRV